MDVLCNVLLLVVGHGRFDAWRGDDRVAFTAQDHIDMTALLSEGVKHETIRRYANGWKLWMTFLESRKDLGIEKNPYLERISSDDRRRIIVLFIFHLHEHEQKHCGGIDGIMSAVAFFFKSHSYCTEVFKDPTVRLAKAGCASRERNVEKEVKARRLPVTYDMVQYLELTLWHGQEVPGYTTHGGLADIDHKMAYVGIILAFHFMLRCSEYVFECAKDGRLDPSHALLANDVEFITTSGLRYKPGELRSMNIPLASIMHVRLIIRSSKTDQNGKRGRNLILSRRGKEESHLIQILYEWVFLSGIGTKADDPFLSRYKTHHGRATRLILVRKTVNIELKKMAVFFGFDDVYFSSHSLRIGGATTMAAGGGSRERIKRIADWAAESNSDLLYARSNGKDGGTLTIVDSCISFVTDSEWSQLLTSLDVQNMVPVIRYSSFEERNPGTSQRPSVVAFPPSPGSMSALPSSSSSSSSVSGLVLRVPTASSKRRTLPDSITSAKSKHVKTSNG